MELETLNRIYLELSQFVTAKTWREIALEKERDQLQGKYWDLIGEVQNVIPDESRHESAKRYIREREAPSDSQAEQALKQEVD